MLKDGKLNKYSTFLYKLIDEHPFMLSSQLIDALRNEFKSISPDYPRKLIERAVVDGVFYSSKPLTFGNGQFLYLNHNFNLDKDLIKEVSRINRPPLYRLLNLMDLNNGVVSYYEALKVTASTDEKTSTKISLTKDIVRDLNKCGIIREASDVRNIKYLIYKDEDDKFDSIVPTQLMTNHYNSMVIDTIFIPDILRWLQACNIIDNIKVIYRSSKFPSLGAIHNGIIWDAFGYTKTTGINGIVAVEALEITKQTLVVLDIIISREYMQIDFDAFISRVQIHINSTKEIARTIVPIIFYNTINERTLNIAKKNGFMVFALSSIFGGNVSNLIYRIKKAQIQNLENSEFRDIRKTLKLIEQNGLDEILKSLRGALFEAILYPLLNLKYGNSRITQGKIILDRADEKKYREFDYFIESANPNEIILVELKGYPKTSSIALGNFEEKGTLKYFFKGSVPFAQKNLRPQNGELPNIKAVFITSGGFYDDGYKFLEAIKKGKFKSKNLACYYDGDDLIELLKQNDLNYEAKTIKKFSINKTDSNIDSKTKKAL